MLTLLNGHSLAERGACDLKDQASGREKKKAVENGCVTKDTSQEAFEKSLALPVLVRYLCSAMLTGKLSRSVESFSQVKHGNTSFLLTQESGSHLCEVALTFRREPSAIRFSHVKHIKNLRGDDP